MAELISIKGVSKSFGNKNVLNSINFEVKTKNIIGLIGDNGCGKTTLLKLINKLLYPESGEVNYRNDIRIQTLSDGNRNLYWNLTGLENLEYFYTLSEPSSKFNIDKIKEELLFFNMSNHIHKKVSTYSKGMKQKLLLIIAFMTRPNLILMDEPLNGIDYETSLMFQDYLKKYVERADASIIITSHDMSFLKDLCNYIYKIEDGILRPFSIQKHCEYCIYFTFKNNHLNLKVLDKNNNIGILNFTLEDTYKLAKLLNDSINYTPYYIKGGEGYID
ncbi:ABC transporter ATP-binding protein [Staphylococcus pseudintermedius]|uniref:ABC transporter ATP-binding protein n=3 Tax=Staphylococcus pseudintermedius TaxID=283734 RepID=UPI001655BA13|nr:ABC transporter ATP-binding protein [Staphylococcus pseudintermedius]EIQ3872081.1 ABC transporter ATP-binding protein [Staphylococcus pseudintermedius]EJA1900641.1 ABC transporter ATP-binding protein [Staphylococcus pseudintermedius]EKO0830901.1 ABC transporter ATP-binding protein [Staphylococcus pseudintermedius]MBC8676859.1 ABC transporter ATP-binding protein [Staphylococcus pseudintermedius]MBJ8282143.1 ABC transporter ATP-binding protein [Staphylococcus pseudintermedius]